MALAMPGITAASDPDNAALFGSYRWGKVDFDDVPTLRIELEAIGPTDAPAHERRANPKDYPSLAVPA